MARSNKKNNNNNHGAKNTSINEEDKKLLDIAKQALKDNELDINAFIQLLEEDYTNIYEEKKKNIDSQLEIEKTEMRSQIEESLKKENSELINKNQELSESVKEAEKKLEGLNKQCEECDNDIKTKLEAAQSESESIISAAQSESEMIISNAEKEAESINESYKNELKDREDAVKAREDSVEDKELENDARDEALNAREKHIDSLKNVYEKANPDKLESLEKRIQLQSAEIDSIRNEYATAQAELNKIRIKMIHAEGVSPEELQSENEQLLAKVEELENKCNRYTDFQLNEMKNAYDEKDGYLTQIRNLTNEVAESRNELTRLNNAIMEYEQLKSQMELLRTLNDHLRNELDNTKRMLESNVGDICPALTGIDIEESAESGDSFNKAELRKSNLNGGRIKSLKDLVDHVKKYAASRNKPLFYSDADLRAFIAGMAASPLAILQGMSGTGKTSLPKIFGEALMGEVNVVPVESSWRDRNELLGYYNDFSKKFTAKEFTCDLYRAGSGRYDDTIYFIVLDEMNLSRVEYYFADFLSVLEDKKDNWLIKLVDTDMRQLPSEITKEVLEALNNDNSDEGKELLDIVNKLYENNSLNEEAAVSVSGNEKLRLISYLSNKKFKNAKNTRGLVGGPQKLINGNMIRIPKNVWFIGTANRDESTFEITDKVYDRAQVLNFNVRAKGNKESGDVPQIYLGYKELMDMFTVARASCMFNAENFDVLKEIEAILKENFRVSYGNRIQDQMNIFVPVYVAAGIDSNWDDKTIDDNVKKLKLEAIDYQLTNKVLRKLEYEEFSADVAKKLRTIFEKADMVEAKKWIDWKMRGE